MYLFYTDTFFDVWLDADNRIKTKDLYIEDILIVIF